MHFKLDKRFQDNDFMALIIFSAENLALMMDDSMLQLFFSYHCEAIKGIKEINYQPLLMHFTVPVFHEKHGNCQS